MNTVPSGSEVGIVTHLCSKQLHFSTILFCALHAFNVQDRRTKFPGTNLVQRDKCCKWAGYLVQPALISRSSRAVLLNYYAETIGTEATLDERGLLS